LVGIITDQVHNPFPCNRFDAAFSSPSSDEEVVVEEEEFIDIENLTFDIPSPEGGQQMAQEELEDVEAVFQRLRPTTPTLQRSASLDSVRPGGSNLSTYLMYLSIYLYIYISLYLSIYLSYVSIYLYIYLSISITD
jgi:hypothetical protein